MQIKALQEATQEAFNKITEKSKNKTTLTFKIIQTKSGTKNFEVPEGYEVRLDRAFAAHLKIPPSIFASNINEFVWITCELVGETCMGETAMRLLTPTPLRILSDVVVNKEYVPIEINKFSLIELKMFTNLRTLEPLEAPYDMLIVLHFKPRHKRIGGECKRHCSDGCSSRFLQQTANGGLTQGEL